MMAKRIKDEKSDEYELLFIFSNTGEEDERTLIFADACDKAWGLNLVWVEAVVSPVAGEGTRHRVVTFETASRHGEPYEEVVKKYGISNQTFQPCNRELKLNPMKSYLASIGWTDYQTAIGIRADEDRRVNKRNADTNQIIYPLIDWWPTDKQEVKDFWEDQPFQLGMQEHEGNCRWCWKKSDRKHFRLISENPSIYDFPRRMEQKYGWHGAPHYGVPQPGAQPRRWFRGYRSVDDLFAQAQAIGVQPAVPIKEVRSHAARQFSLDLETGNCSESCEIYEAEIP
jgi:hypothetical protein